MTRRFYFDLNNGQDVIRDDEGVDATDLAEAIEEAQAVIDEMRGSKTLSSSQEGWHLVIRDESGENLRTMPLD